MSKYAFTFKNMKQVFVKLYFSFLKTVSWKYVVLPEKDSEVLLLAVSFYLLHFKKEK